MTERSTDNNRRKKCYCSICGSELPDPSFALNYPNMVCDECDSRAVGADNREPWHGYPPGEAPETEPGTILMPPDHGENPVFVNGIKCWRRYKFGGWVTLRDAFDCRTLRDFYDRHQNNDRFLQVYNSPEPTGPDIQQDRVLIQKFDSDEMELYAWGMLSLETGEVLTRNVNAEAKLGPFEDFFDLLQGHTGDREDFERTRTDPTRLLSIFDFPGAQAHKPQAIVLTPELDRPLTGNEGIVEIGALQGLRTHDTNEEILELGVPPASKRYSKEQYQDESGTTWKELLEASEKQATESQNANEGSYFTIRYHLPSGGDARRLRKRGTEVASSVFASVCEAVEETDYLFSRSLPAVSIHAYRAQKELLSISVSSETIAEVEWGDETRSPKSMRKSADTVLDRLQHR